MKKLFGKFIKGKQKYLKMPEWNEVVELLHDKNLVFPGSSVEIVIYSEDKSRRCIVLKSDNGFYTYRFEQIYQYTEEEWIYFGNDSDAVPGFWTDVESRNTSIFSSLEETVKELEHEGAYKTYFS